MTAKELRKNFETYTSEIQRLIDAKAFWALLHYSLIFPDICGALESNKGQATGPRYRDWARRYVEDSHLSAEEWWDIRCLLLHQGRTLGRKRYSNYKFVRPASGGVVFHKNTLNNNIICLDVTEMSGEVTSGLEKWFQDIAAGQDPDKSRNVRKNIASLASEKEDSRPLGKAVVGLNLMTTSS